MVPSALLCMLLHCAVKCSALYFEFSSKSYCPTNQSNAFCESEIPVFAKRLVSSESIESYDNSAFDFCQADSQIKPSTENLGQVISGDEIYPSPYKFLFLRNDECKKVCDKVYHSNDEKLQFLKYGILHSYRIRWIVDNLPLTWCYTTADDSLFCTAGFPIGCYVDKSGSPKDACVINTKFNQKDSYYIFNHVDITLYHHSDPHADRNGSRIVKAALKFDSYKTSGCKGGPLAIPQDSQDPVHINYTYSVRFVEDKSIEWASRWDLILRPPPGNILWFSILNTIISAIILGGINAFVIIRRVRMVTTGYSQLESAKDVQEKCRWKLLYGDVFRPPPKAMLLSSLTGVGSQVVATAFMTLFIGCTGILSPANRGALVTCSFLLFIFHGVVAGYVSARLYKTLGNGKWKHNAAMMSFLVSGEQKSRSERDAKFRKNRNPPPVLNPLATSLAGFIICVGESVIAIVTHLLLWVVFGIHIILNLILWGKGGPDAIPISTLLIILALWLGVSVPLTFIGAYIGNKKASIEPPVEVNPIRRRIPRQGCCKKPFPVALMTSILPFGCIYISAFFILNSLWFHQVFYQFGYLLVMTITLVISCSTVTTISCFLHLSSEDYRWWWRSFMASGSSAFYFFIYAMFFYFRSIATRDFTSVAIYFGYTLIMSLALFLFTGTVGFATCFWFVRKLYARSLVFKNGQAPLSYNVAVESEETVKTSTSQFTCQSPPEAPTAVSQSPDT